MERLGASFSPHPLDGVPFVLAGDSVRCTARLYNQGTTPLYNVSAAGSSQVVDVVPVYSSTEWVVEFPVTPADRFEGVFNVTPRATASARRQPNATRYTFNSYYPTVVDISNTTVDIRLLPSIELPGEC